MNAEADRDGYRKGNRELQAELDALQVKFTDACFEVDRMRPVVDEAMSVGTATHVNTITVGEFLDLKRAIDAYRAAKGADDE
jgi:hypothetical protein